MNRLRELRESKNLKQKDVAKLISKTVQAYSLYELNRRNIDNDALKTLSEFYGVSVGYLLGTETQIVTWDTQLFSNPNADPANVSFAMGKVLSLKNDEAKKLTLQIMDEVLRLTIPQLEALGAFLKTIK